MRLIMFAAVGVVFLLASTPGWAQKDKKTPEKIDEKKDPTSFINDIAGRTLEQYIKDIPSKDRSKAETAVRTVVLFGPERAAKAVPVMLAVLEKHTASYPVDLSLRLNIPVALATILTNIKDPDPQLVRRTILLLNRLVRGDSQALVKNRAVQGLAQFGPNARLAAPDLISNLIALTRDPQVWENRQAAVMALGTVAQDRKYGPPIEVLRALSLSLRDPASQVRLAAIQSFSWLGPPPNLQDLKTLEGALDRASKTDPEPSVQIWANVAIMSLTNNVAADRLNPLIKMLEDPDVATRVLAAQTLGMIGPKAKAAVPTLIQSLADSDPNMANMSIWALAQMEDFAAKALPILQQISNDEKQIDVLRKSAAEAIDIISGKKKKEKEEEKKK